MVSQKQRLSSRCFQKLYLILSILFTIKVYSRINAFREKKHVDSKIRILFTEGKVNIIVAISQKFVSVGPVH